MDLNSDIPKTLSDLIERTLHIEPARRPTVKELHEGLLNPTAAVSGGGSGTPTFPGFIKLMVKEPSLYRPIDSTTTIGQEQLRIYPDAAYVSASQFRIVKDTATTRWLIEGLPGVTNNTRLNGAVVTGKSVQLKNGDALSIGNFKATIRFA